MIELKTDKHNSIKGFNNLNTRYRKRIINLIKNREIKPIFLIYCSEYKSLELQNWISFVNPITDTHIGSSIKFCYLAEGQVDFYPRTSPTMEWDIAAGHSVLKAAGGNIVSSSGIEIRYGKENFKNKSKDECT